MKLPNKFSLREVFWLVLLCAFGIGWWLERSRARAAEAEKDKYRDQAVWLLDVTKEHGSLWVKDDGTPWQHGDDVMVGYDGNRIADGHSELLAKYWQENNELRSRLGEPVKQVNMSKPLRKGDKVKIDEIPSPEQKPD